MFKLSSHYNPNYLAKIVQLKNPIKHPNADRLLGWDIDGNRVWTTTDYQEREICIFFPLECVINKDILSRLNLFEDKTLNSDQTKAGFFSTKGRVKAVKLRGQPSEGFLLRVHDFVLSLPEINFESQHNFVFGQNIGFQFDNWDDIWICRKYVSETRTEHIHKIHGGQNKNKTNIVDGQFKFHYSTDNLKNNLNVLSNPETKLTISYKYHGTSGITANLLTYKKRNWFQKAYDWFTKQKPTEYSVISASRSVIKTDHSMDSGYYKFDIWQHVSNIIKDIIDTGETWYYEIVGYLPNGSMIQKDYDYGCTKPIDDDYQLGVHFDIYVYRITKTYSAGQITEYPMNTVKTICEIHGFKHVEILDEITVGQLTDNLSIVEDKEKAILEYLKTKYLETDCHVCTNKVPAEGICIRVEDGITDKAYKLKSFRFLQKESKQLDEEVVDIETSQTEI
jgi:hypothetical protein